MTEVVDKTLIERLILEHSDRLELEVNQKARADAWKFYYRVRIDHVVRPFAVCKVCYRVLHCDSRSGTASLLRHPCNPLSERSPVNRAVKLSAKLNLPSDNIKNELLRNDRLVSSLSPDIRTNGINNRNSPVSHLIGNNNSTPVPNCSSPNSGGSASPPSTTVAPLNIPNFGINGGKKRKAGTPAPAFPLDLRLLQLPHMMAAVAAHPLAALNLANATALLSDPQYSQHIQTQQSQIETIIREHQLQQEREFKRNREDDKNLSLERNGNIPRENNNPIWDHSLIKKERQDNGHLYLGSSDLPSKDHGGRNRSDDNDSRGIVAMSKEVVQHLVYHCSDRVKLMEKDSGGSHYISDVWSRFQVVYVDDVLRPFASCKNCHKIVTYTKYSGTGGLLRHRCSIQDSMSKISPVKDLSSPVEPSSDSHSSPVSVSEGLSSPNNLVSLFGQTDYLGNNSQNLTRPRALQNETLSSKDIATSPLNIPKSAMIEVARALLRYMCHDLKSASTIDTPAFHQLVWTVLNISPMNGMARKADSFPSSHQLLNSFLPPFIVDSREIIAKDLQTQNYLCFSLYSRNSGNENILTASIHYISNEFNLKSHALGTCRVFKGDTRDDSLHGLLRDFFQDLWTPSALQEKFLTIVTDEGDSGILGSSGVKCIWHSVELVLENLTDVLAYSKICEDVKKILAFLADTGMEGINAYELRSSEVHRWEALLHAISFIISHYEELRVLLSESKDLPFAPDDVLSRQDIYEEVRDLLIEVRRCLMTVKDFKRPTLNQAVLFRAKLLQLCSSPSNSSVSAQVKEYLCGKFESALALDSLHLVASFLDPRCKSLKVLTEQEKGEVHRLVLEMMKAVSVTEANSGVLNLKTTRRSPALSSSPDGNDSAQDAHPFIEYMDNPGTDLSVSDSEEIMAYVNMKVHLDNDDILGWWASASAAGLPTLRRLARKVLAVPATCAFACNIDAHAVAAREKMGIADQSQVNNVLHVRYNMS